MTIQFTETLIYEGKELGLLSTPLCVYFGLIGHSAEDFFESTNTACHRGYVAEWLIENNRLYLIVINGELQNGMSAKLNDIFSNCSNRVFAHWYSDQICCPRGKLIGELNQGYTSIFEEDLLIDIKKGMVTSTSVRKNSMPIDDDELDGNEKPSRSLLSIIRRGLYDW